MGVVTELEAPTSLLTVAETEAIDCRSVRVAATVPENVNGIDTVNCPPKLWEAVLWNQTVATWWRSTVTWEEAKVKPVAAVNWTFNVVSVRVVEKPVKFNVTLLLLVAATAAATSTGAAAGT